MNIRYLLAALFTSLSLSLNAQTATQLNAVEIKLGLQKLNIVGSALYIAAHPDDENTRLLSYLTKERKVRTAYLSLTRGDGGQNLIGNEQGELLGLIRTQELLAARRMDGAEQFFTRANDFGFSKTSDETFNIWGKEQILADVVWVIRKFKPDVIIARFPEDARAGHGHHAASAIIAREAFIAAADPKRFPEQLKHVQTWQAKRMVWNTYNFGGNNTTSDDQLKLDVGLYNPLLGKGYGEIAAESRSNHKSQGFGSASQRGQSFEYFKHVAGDAAQTELFDGINIQWSRLAGSGKIAGLISQASESFSMDDPSKSVPALVSILTELEELKDTYWKEQKEKEIKELIAAAAGLWFESYAAAPGYAIGDSVKIRSQLILRSAAPINLKSVSGLPQNTPLNKDILKTVESSMAAAAISEPYWLTEDHAEGFYTIKNQTLVGSPENPDPLKVSFKFSIYNKDISFDRELVYKFTDPVRGEIYQPLIIAPLITATLTEKAYVFAGNTPKTIQVQLKSFRNNTEGILKPGIPQGWKIEPEQVPFTLSRKNDESNIRFTITPSGPVALGKLSFSISTAKQTYNRGIKVLSYDHIPKQTLFPLSEARLEKIDLKTNGKRIGYLTGAGDLIPEALKQIGYDLTMLTENQVLNENLSAFDAIITGVRAYNVNPKMASMQFRLMTYVQNGGTLLVQYNVNNPLVIPNPGPYPFKISRDRVTDENAKVTFLNPAHPVLNYPNKITGKDFEGWVQERGLYFVSDIDPGYTPILRMNDANEPASDGSLIVADYGKGKFVYTSLAFFRELPAGVPGAYRLFVNLISQKKD